MHTPWRRRNLSSSPPRSTFKLWCECSKLRSAAEAGAHSLQLAGTQREAACYKRSSACVLPLPDECGEATNWTADHACWMAYVSASNDLPVETPVTGREESSRHHLTCERARSPPLCISLILHFVVQTLRWRCRMPGGNESSRSDALEELHAARIWTAHAD